jgi:protein phosphatase
MIGTRVGRWVGIRGVRAAASTGGWYLATDAGLARDNNEDSVVAEPIQSAAARRRGLLCVLADGIGGQAAGEVASHLAVDTVRQVFYASPRWYSTPRALRSAIVAANDAIWSTAINISAYAGMGSTLTAAVVQGRRLVVGHVGDSRAYLLHAGRAIQITRDHSWVAEQVSMGVLTPEQARKHSRRNVILRSLGQSSNVCVDVYECRLRHDDVVLLCSDGLTSVLSDEEIADCASQLGLPELVTRLVDIANERGGPDNVTVAAHRIHLPESRLRHAIAVDDPSALLQIAFFYLLLAVALMIVAQYFAWAEPARSQPASMAENVVPSSFIAEAELLCNRDHSQRVGGPTAAR